MLIYVCKPQHYRRRLCGVSLMSYHHRPNKHTHCDTHAVQEVLALQCLYLLNGMAAWVVSNARFGQTQVWTWFLIYMWSSHFLHVSGNSPDHINVLDPFPAIFRFFPPSSLHFATVHWIFLFYWKLPPECTTCLVWIVLGIGNKGHY